MCVTTWEIIIIWIIYYYFFFVSTRKQRKAVSLYSGSDSSNLLLIIKGNADQFSPHPRRFSQADVVIITCWQPTERLSASCSSCLHRKPANKILWNTVTYIGEEGGGGEGEGPLPPLFFGSYLLRKIANFWAKKANFWVAPLSPAPP